SDRDEPSTGRIDGGLFDAVDQRAERRPTGSGGNVPDVDGPIATAGDELLAVRCHHDRHRVADRYRRALGDEVGGGERRSRLDERTQRLGVGGGGTRRALDGQRQRQARLIDGQRGR